MTMPEWLERCLADDLTHSLWLNTLSLMENCGARLIARCEHPIMVSSVMLRHAAEEFRHAYQLRAFANKLAPWPIADYSLGNVLGGRLSHHYLPLLNVQVVRLLRGAGLAGIALIEAAYLLVTYAIELRALELYNAYDSLLTQGAFPISVRGILREETHHLEEIEGALAQCPVAASLATRACRQEAELFCRWTQALTGAAPSSPWRTAG